ncbi:MAG TPA: Vms1/Ankzf1 family peptidyl-tRNA hydrolase [Jatrophihabitantaceae bacterium]
MHTDTDLAAVYRHGGPFATVYLDATRASESGAREVELRWRARRTDLADRGASGADLAALDDVIAADRTPGRAGLVAVAAAGSVVFVDHLPDPPRRAEIRLAPLPHLMPYLAQRGPRVPYLVVVADRSGADIAGPPWADVPETTVTGSDRYPLHRSGRDDWSEWHFQHRVENSWESNARDAAQAVAERAAAGRAALVVLAGDERARALLQDELASGLREGTEVVQVEPGGRADGASPEPLAAAVDNAVLHHVWRWRRELLARMQQNLGRAEFAVAGVADVVDAVRRAAVDTVVISDDPSSTLRAYIGPQPVHIGLTEDELHALGVDSPQQDRLDAALIRAVLGTGAHLVVTPNAHHYLPNGIGALLRYDDRVAS